MTAPRYLVQGRAGGDAWRTVYRVTQEAYAFVIADDLLTEQASRPGVHGRHVYAKYAEVRITLGAEVIARWHDGRRIWPPREAATQLGLLEAAS